VSAPSLCRGCDLRERRGKGSRRAGSGLCCEAATSEWAPLPQRHRLPSLDRDSKVRTGTSGVAPRLTVVWARRILHEPPLGSGSQGSAGVQAAVPWPEG